MHQPSGVMSGFSGAQNRFPRAAKCRQQEVWAIEPQAIGHSIRNVHHPKCISGEFPKKVQSSSCCFLPFLV